MPSRLNLTQFGSIWVKFCLEDCVLTTDGVQIRTLGRRLLPEPSVAATSGTEATEAARSTRKWPKWVVFPCSPYYVLVSSIVFDKKKYKK